jgi:hypothetical protein
MYEGGGMRAYVFPLQPLDAKSWDALIDVDFPIPLARRKDATLRREFGVTLKRGSEIVHAFSRSITLQSTKDGDGTIERRITFLEPATLKPGRYEVTAVLSDPQGDKPFTSKVELRVPEIPKQGEFLTDSIVVRRGGDDVVVYGRMNGASVPSDRVGSRASFRPLLVSEVDRGQPLAALTHACIVNPRRGDGPWVAARTLLTEDGSAAGGVPDIEFARDGRDKFQCRRLFDEVHVGALRLGRYTFQATLARAGAGLAAAETRQVPIALVATAAAQP